MSSEVEVLEFMYGIIRCMQPEFVVETGTYKGLGALAIGKALEANGHGRLFSTEIHVPYIQTARELCKGLPVDIVEMSSLDYAPDRDIDFAWFDSEPAIRADEFRKYYPRLTGLVGFHDTYFNEVWNGIKDLEREGLIIPIVFKTPRGMCLAQVVHP